MQQDLFQIPVRTIDGREETLAPYKGQVLLIVNVASQCGYTPQYAGLSQLFEKHKEQGFQVLGFPCNQFGAQEPGSEKEIQSFCELTFGVKFPMFAKVDVNGPNAHPLFEYLKSHARGILGSESIKWNFTKFLVNRKGEVLERYAPNTEPHELEKDILKVL